MGDFGNSGSCIPCRVRESAKACEAVFLGVDSRRRRRGHWGKVDVVSLEKDNAEGPRTTESTLACYAKQEQCSPLSLLHLANRRLQTVTWPGMSVCCKNIRDLHVNSKAPQLERIYLLGPTVLVYPGARTQQPHVQRAPEHGSQLSTDTCGVGVSFFFLKEKCAGPSGRPKSNRRKMYCAPLPLCMCAYTHGVDRTIETSKVPMPSASSFPLLYRFDSVRYARCTEAPLRPAHDATGNGCV